MSCRVHSDNERTLEAEHRTHKVFGIYPSDYWKWSFDQFHVKSSEVCNPQGYVLVSSLSPVVICLHPLINKTSYHNANNGYLQSIVVVRELIMIIAISVIIM